LHDARQRARAIAAARALGTAFLKPIFAMARLDPQAVPLLEALRTNHER
jgi:hypothetical protein